jgi:hypothetical protein
VPLASSAPEMPSGMPSAVPAATTTSSAKSRLTSRRWPRGSGWLMSGRTQMAAANQHMAIHRIEIWECHPREMVTGTSDARSRPM